MTAKFRNETHGRCVSVAVLLFSLLVIGITARLKGLAEGTEIIFAALAGIGILVNRWLGAR